MSRRLSIAPINQYRWESEEVFHAGDPFYGRLLQDIADAKSTIDLEVYIFAADQTGGRVIEALKAAASRGVHVRILVDGFGSYAWLPWHRQQWQHARIYGRVFKLWPWPFNGEKLPRIPSWKVLSGSVTGMNHRDHRKTIIIDDQIAFVGSLNICDCHSEIVTKSKAWRDTGVRLTGPGITDLRQSFQWGWEHAEHVSTRERLRIQRVQLTGLVRLNYLKVMRRHFSREFLYRVRHATTRVWLTTPYFVPEVRQMRALIAAAKHGADVRLLVPRLSDVPLVRWASTAFYEPLLKNGVQIFEYLPTVLHAKVAILDDWVAVGSTNLNHRSLLYDLEVDALLTDRRSREDLQRQFEEDMKKSERISPGLWPHRHLFLRMIGHVLLLFKNWM